MFVAEFKGCSPNELVYESGRVYKKYDEEVSMTLAEIGGASTYGGVYLMGAGGFLRHCEPQQI